MRYKYIKVFNQENDFTLTADMKLYCDLSSKRVLIRSIFPIGCFIGLFFVNLLSDTRGRKFAFQLALSICLAGLLCTCFSNVSNFVRWRIINNVLFNIGAIYFRIWFFLYNTIGVYNTLRFFEWFLSSCCTGDNQLSRVIFFVMKRFCNIDIGSKLFDVYQLAQLLAYFHYHSFNRTACNRLLFFTVISIHFDEQKSTTIITSSIGVNCKI